MVEARAFLPNPVFGLPAWGLLPILRIFTDLPTMGVFQIVPMRPLSA